MLNSGFSTRHENTKAIEIFYFHFKKSLERNFGTWHTQACGLPDGIPLWPIISMTGATTYSPAKYLEGMLSSCLGNTLHHVKSSSPHLTISASVLRTSWSVIFNVINLFTKVPIKVVLNLLSQHFEDNMPCPDLLIFVFQCAVLWSNWQSSQGFAHDLLLPWQTLKRPKPTSIWMPGIITIQLKSRLYFPPWYTGPKPSVIKTVSMRNWDFSGTPSRAIAATTSKFSPL